MFIGVFKNPEGEIENYIYFSNEAWYKDTFSPATEEIGILEFKITGKNYEERKASLEEIAIEWSNNFSNYNWSYSELGTIETYFYNNARKYGLVREFKENAII